MTRTLSLILLLALAAAVWAADLPISDVVLFSSGVGYFQRSGMVTDDATVALSFKTEQINDLLKSLVLLDLDGGKVGAVTYGAKDPISKTLQAFAVNLTDNPTMGQLLNRLRGVAARVTLQNSNEVITGKILGVEIKKPVVENEVVQVEMLNLLTPDGLRSIRLEDVAALRLLDDKLNAELQNALQVVASGLDNQRKPMLLSFTGKGQRRVLVGYLTETPIWKTSYRLVLGDKESLLQGWAIVENTGDADWTNVRLSLVSGRPISFMQDLYTSLYVPRPLVKPELYTSLSPMAYAGDLGKEAAPEAKTSATPADAAGVDADDADKQQSSDKANATLAGVRTTMPTAASTSFTSNVTLFTNNIGENNILTPGHARVSVVSAAKATDLGQAFQYHMNEPVTLPRQQSALLPIVSGNVGAWKVSIFNPEVHGKFPLYGLRLKNLTGVHLMGGPITIYNDDVYGGDATFEDLQPGEQRLISYAIDLGAECEFKANDDNAQILAFKVVKGVLQVTRKYHRAVEYTCKVKDGKERVLIIEHAYNNGWDLIEPAKADERTDKLYRFTVRMNGKDPVKFPVVEEHTEIQGSFLTQVDTDTIVGYLKTGKVSAKVRDVLQRVMTMQNVVLDYQRKKNLFQQEIQSISTEQERIRRNMGAIDHSSDLYKRYVTKLGAQETRIEKLRELISDATDKEEAQRKELENYVSVLTLE